MANTRGLALAATLLVVASAVPGRAQEEDTTRGEFWPEVDAYVGLGEQYFAGIEWPIGRTPILDTYYARTNDSRSSVAHVDAFGLAFNLFF